MGQLDGKVAFITGAARGQGRSHALRLAEEGADIIAFDLCDQIATVDYPMSTADDLAETVKLVESVGRRIIATEGDVRDAAAVRHAADTGIAEFGRLDIALANAGIMPFTGPDGDSDAAWQDAIDVMLTGVFHTVRATVPHIQSGGAGGSVVITSSTAGIKGVGDGGAGCSGYVAAKHGVVGLMRAWANVYGPESIRFNTVHPTGTNTPMVVNESFGRYAGERPEIVAAMQNVLPVAMVEPEDVTSAILFLVSDQGRYITGQTLAVDAGCTVR